MRAETYSDAVRYIEEIPKFTSKTSLAHTRRLLELLGHPEEGQQVLHVAGTNGKGSVCAALDAMLRAGGYRTGLFTSPHLIRINERFRISGITVSDERFLDAFRRVMEATDRILQEGEPHPTYFEVLFLMGMLLFRDAGVDYTVLETGMGGRLDATNVIAQPLVSIITSISLDHTMYLGETIPEIAAEKAGIIKQWVPVVYDAGNTEAAAVIERRAMETAAPFWPVRHDRIRVLEVTQEGTRFCYSQADGRDVTLFIPQTAPYQTVNAALAWEALFVLRGRIPILEGACAEGLKTIVWPCRMQMVEPGVIIDGAHNPDGIAACIEAVRAFHEKTAVTLLFSAVKDKQYAEMIHELAEGIRPEKVVVTRVRDARGVPEQELAALFRKEGCREVFSEEDPVRAYRKARELRGDGMLFCIGSLYLAGELLEAVHEEQGEKT